MNPPKPTPIAAAVVRHAGNVLIGCRPPGVPLAGLWEFPGGKILEGETPARAAARECFEETGLSIRVGEPCLKVEHAYPHGRVEIHFFAAVPIDPAQMPRHPFRWVPLAQLANHPFPPANDAILAILTAQTQ